MTREKSEVEKKFDELNDAFRAECAPVLKEYQDAWRKATDALEVISEKYGIIVRLHGESYAPKSFTTLHDEEMQEYIGDWFGRIQSYNGQEPGDWWAPSTC